MGATYFNTLAAGRDAAEAFKSAVDTAFHNYGHSGYTGTIAEKRDFVLVPGVERICSTGLAYMISGCEDATTPATKELVRRFSDLYNDKWGPALCIELTGQELKEAKARMGLRGTQKKIYRFFGIASC